MFLQGWGLCNVQYSVSLESRACLFHAGNALLDSAKNYPAAYTRKLYLTLKYKDVSL